jgi:glycosyltransferase involved in cell wall biosynthesis
VATPYPVFPPTHGGRVRSFRLAAGLARAGARVEVLAPWCPGQPPSPYEREGVMIRPQFFSANALALLPETVVPALVALSVVPPGPAARRWLRALAAYDIAQFEFPAHPDWMERAPRSVKIVYSAHNVEYDYLRLQPLRRRVRGTMLRRTRALEQRAVRASDLVVTCTADDASRLEELYGPAPAEVIPNGFDEQTLHPFSRSERVAARRRLQIGLHERVLLFVGGPARHNREAVRYLVDDLRPRLDPEATVLIGGQAGDSHAQTHGKGARVRRLGYMDDVRDAFAAADVALNPVRAGSGSSVKMIEYLAAGLPVVTTPTGVRGLDEASDRIRIAELESFPEAARIPLPPPGQREPWVDRFAWFRLAAQLHERYEHSFALGTRLRADDPAPAELGGSDSLEARAQAKVPPSP